MNAFFSAISGQFPKTLVLGSLLPVLIAVLLWLGLVYPLFPDAIQLHPALKVLDAGWQLTWSSV